MRKRCEKCGKEFEARQSYFKLCPNCFSGGYKTDLSMFLLKDLHDEKGNILREVYLDFPQQLATIFAKDKPALGTKQLRDFHQKIKRARTKAVLRGIDSAKQLLYKCQNEIEYQLKRGVVPKSFAEFMKHYLALAEKDEKMLNGFFEHLDSIVCYYPKSKGGH